MTQINEHYVKYLRYIKNTGKRPLEISAFDKDWEPSGKGVRRSLRDAGLIDEFGGALMLTFSAEDYLATLIDTETN